MLLAWDTSPLSRCAECQIFRAAFFCHPPTIHPRMYGQQDLPILAPVMLIDEDGAEEGLRYDPFKLYRERWERRRVPQSESDRRWMMVTPPWWSDRVSRTIWVSLSVRWMNAHWLASRGFLDPVLSWGREEKLIAFVDK
jgi:hypothetical protein